MKVKNWSGRLTNASRGGDLKPRDVENTQSNTKVTKLEVAGLK
jgi:hypothetical protein